MQPAYEHESDNTEIGLDGQGGPKREPPGATLGELQAFARHVSRRSPCTNVSKRSRFESKSLVAWASKRGLLIDPLEFRERISEAEELPSGNEHQVIFLPQPGRVMKVTRPPRFGARWHLEDYVNNLVWANILFEDDIRLEGVVKAGAGVSIVISQSFIVGRPPSNLEIESWFLDQGYEREGLKKWSHPKTGLVIDDAHIGNFIVMDGNLMIPIDLQIYDPNQTLDQN